MKRLLIVLLLAVSAQAAPLPDAPSATRKPPNPYIAPFRQPEFYVSVGTFTASEFYDIHSTQVCERQRTCVEAYPGHDRYTYALPLVGLVAAGTYGCQLMLYEHKWWRRTVCSGIGIGMSLIHWKDGSTIYHSITNSNEIGGNMGLDMYLSARKYLSGWKHSNNAKKTEFNKLADGAGMSKFVTPHAPSGYLEFHVAYWRKANQIHKWFVDVVQKGVDDCGKYYVEREQLKELRNLCQAILDDPKKAAEELPTQPGFFFGGTDYDEYYLADLKETVSQIDNALGVPDDWGFEYHSSW